MALNLVPLWVFRIESYLWPCHGFLWSNLVPSSVVDFQGRILIMVPNITLWFGLESIITLSLDPGPIVFPNSLFINLLCAHAVFEKCTVHDTLHPPPGLLTVEQSCLGVGNSKTRRTLRQQLTILY